MGKKRFIKTVITCALVCCLCFSGCGAGTPNQDTEIKNSEAVGSAADSTQPSPSTQPAPEEYFRAPMPEQNIPEGREVVTLGTFGDVYAWSPMYGTVNAFNQAQEKYFVYIEIYSSYNGFLIDIARKQGTDLYDLWRGVSVDILVDKGILEDLTPYFESSTAVSRDDIVDAVWRAGSVDDKLYFLIPGFRCNGIIVEKGHTNEGAWSGKDYLELGKKYPGSMLNNYIQSPSLQLMTPLKEYMEAFINWKDMTCSFDGDEFIALLEDLKALGSYKYEPVDGSTTLAELIRGKTYLTDFESLGMDFGMCNYQDITDAFGDSYELAGLPTADGSLKYGLTYDQIYGMNAASGNKEGAWAFLEYLVSEEYQQPNPPSPLLGETPLLGFRFPARKDSLEQGLQANVDYVTDPDGSVVYRTNSYTGERIEGYEGFTEEDKQAVLRIIDNAYRSAFERDYTLLNILFEEAEPFFEGQKSAEDVVKIIQSRVSLYLDE